MTKPTDHQLTLRLSGEPEPRHVALKRAANKKRGQALSISASLPFKDRYFLPLTGVPKTRGDCPPPSEYCRYIRCRYHLAMIDAEHRAGRPGLASVPRDARGWTVPVEGDIGDARAGTTFDPRWKEYERRCRVWTEKDESGKFLALHAAYESESDLFLERLHAHEPIDVLRGMVDEGEPFRASESHPRVMGAKMTTTGVLAFEAELTEFSYTLVRVRGVESCALNMIDRIGKCSNQESGAGLGRHRTLVARELRGATRKAIERAADVGIEAEDLMKTLMQMGGMR